MQTLDFPKPVSTPEARSLRGEVRAFLAETHHKPRADSWTRFDPDFTRALARRGWIGMTWPKRYGGGARSALERYIVIEELLAAGAPVGAHWIADRQVGPLLLAYGTEEQRVHVLPRIAEGGCYIAIGLSEPGVGSDLASVRTRATPVEDGFRLNGAKIWTSGAHLSHYIVVLCRTDGEPGDRHSGLSQLLVDMTWPGISVRPIIDMTGAHSFNEVLFDDVFAPASALIGTRGGGWAQVMSELANERSGPERFLSSFVVLEEMAKAVRTRPSDEGHRVVGRLVAHIAVLRRLSMSIAEMINQGRDPSVQAALVKDVGAVLEQEIPHVARQVFALDPSTAAADALEAIVAEALLAAPSFSLRGGAREILRGIIARRL